MPSFGKKSQEKLNTCDPRLIELFERVVEDFELGYNTGVAVSYLLRAGKKEGNPAEQDIQKAKFEELSSEMLEFLIQKGILEKVLITKNNKEVTTYRLTVSGSGCLLHLSPTLALD